MTNKELANLINSCIIDNGINKSFIADKLGISRQAFDKLLNKKQFSIDDANRILNVIGYKLTDVVIKKI